MKQRCNRLMVFAAVAWFLLATAFSLANADGITVGSRAEWLPARTILMHTPGQEFFLGVVHPNAALFEKPFSIDRAAAEHRNYIRLLEAAGVTVHTVVGAMLEGTIDANGNPLPGPKLDELRSFAKEFLTYDTSGFSSEERQRQTAYRDGVITGLHPRELISIILTQPVVYLRTTAINTGFEARYALNPVMNLYFLRDQLITTPKGMVVGQMNSTQRVIETRIIKFVLKKLGITPLHEISGDGRLEGGDFIPAGDVVFQGQGLRTNAEAIRQILDRGLYGAKTVIVVKERWHNQEQMHLDTYFNVIDRDLAVLVETRLRRDGQDPDPRMRLTADIYQMENESYRLIERDLDFQEYIENRLKMKIIPAPADDQLKYGVNFLTVTARKIFAVDGVSDGYKKALKDGGGDATWIDFRNLTGGYGAAHCVTQVLRRE